MSSGESRLKYLVADALEGTDFGGKVILVNKNSFSKKENSPGAYRICSYSSPKIVFMKSYCFEKNYVDLTC